MFCGMVCSVLWWFVVFCGGLWCFVVVCGVLWCLVPPVHGRFWPNFKLIQAYMYVIITCKYEKDPIKKKREKVATPFFKL